MPDADTWDQVVRAVGHSGHLDAAALLMRASRAHAHDAELLWLTRAVRCRRSPGQRHNETLLSRAARRLDAQRVAEILAACPTRTCRMELLRARGVWGSSALYAACMYFRSDDCGSEEPLDEAYETKVIALVDVLLCAGADPNASDSDYRGNLGDEPLLLAAYWSARLVRRLLDAGAQLAPNSRYNDAGLLNVAVISGNFYKADDKRVAMLDELVAMGVRAPPGNEIMCSWAGACTNDESTPAAVIAIVKALVRGGCSVSLPSGTFGYTPLERALERDNEPVVRALLTLGAPTTAKSWVLAVRRDGCNAPVLTSLLRAAGVPTDELVVPLGGEEGRTALMEAARYGSLGSVQLLLDAGASVAPHNERGQDALMWAAQAKPFTFGGGALEVAVVSALLDAGADFDARDVQGWSVLHHLAHSACGASWAAAGVELLRDHGAVLHMAHDGRFPWQVPPVGGVCTCGLHVRLLVVAFDAALEAAIVAEKEAMAAKQAVVAAKEAYAVAVGASSVAAEVVSAAAEAVLTAKEAAGTASAAARAAYAAQSTAQARAEAAIDTATHTLSAVGTGNVVKPAAVGPEAS